MDMALPALMMVAEALTDMMVIVMMMMMMKLLSLLRRLVSYFSFNAIDLIYCYTVSSHLSKIT